MDTSAIYRKAVESQYIGTCCVFEYRKYRDDVTKIAKEKEEMILSDVPCRLSFSSLPAASGDGTAVSRQQAVKLFLAPEILVKAGSKIVVTQNGATQEYKNSGEPAIYSSHQEINLELFRRWA